MTHHTDKNVYLISYLRASLTALSPEDSKLVGQMGLLLRSHLGVAGFSGLLLDLLRSHPSFEETDRVCLVRARTTSRQLAVLDSACSANVGLNLMSPGYRCFVRPDSSLFELQEGVARIFNNTDEVIKSFEKNHQEVQRSINYIHQMGFKSGVCLPLAAVNGIQGFLFLNSVKPYFYSQATKLLAQPLSIISMFARSFLFMHALENDLPIQEAISPGMPVTCTALSEIRDELERVATQLNKNHDLPVHIISEACPFLFSSYSFIKIFTWVLLILGLPTSRPVLELTSARVRSRIIIEFNNFDRERPSPVHLKNIRNLASMHGYNFEWVYGQNPQIDFEYDAPDISSGRYYSI